MDLRATLEFLEELTLNNNTAWMSANKDRLTTLRSDFTIFTQRLIDRLASEVDSSLVGVEARDCIFRQNRDIRFSHDKSPYKNHFGAYCVAGGRKSQRAGYYIHLQPGNGSLIGGGVHCPDPERLKEIRQEILYNGDALEKLLFGISDQFPEVLGDKLKTVPRGYPKDHPQAELLKQKGFDLMCFYPDKSLTNDQQWMDEIIAKFRVLYPVTRYFNFELDK